MRLGIDLDNTIVCYDFVFRKVAEELDIVPKSLPDKAKAVKAHLFLEQKETVWTELQGVVYGPRMKDATPFPGVVETLIKAKAKGIHCFIVSHKTSKPVIGPPISLHEIALEWIRSNLVDEKGAPLVPRSQIFLEETRAEKIARVSQLKLDYFLEDLPDVLADIGKPDETILFDPHHKHPGTQFTTIHEWKELEALLGL